MKKIILLSVSILIINFNNSFAYEFQSFNYDQLESCNKEVCIDVSELKHKVLSQGFKTQTEYERLYRSRKNIMVKLGMILPHFNLGTGLSAVNFAMGSYVEGVGTLVSSFLGFLFPSRWYKWKESKMFFYSNRQSYLTLVANQVNTVENIFFAIQREFINYNIINHYILEIEKILHIINERDENGEIPSEEITKIEILRSDLISTKIIIENIMDDLRPELIHLLGLTFDANWEEIGLKFVKIPNLSTLDPIDTRLNLSEAIEKSSEIKSLKYLYYAAKYAKKYRMFAFLDPASDIDSALGFGYMSSMKIAGSQAKTMLIKRDQMKSKIRMLLMQIENHHNTSIDLYNEAMNGKMKSEELIEVTMSDFFDTNNLNTDDIIDAMNWMIKFDVYKNLSVSMYFNAKSRMNRILWKKINKEEILGEVPRRSYKLRRFNDRHMRSENRKINRAIRSGSIQL